MTYYYDENGIRRVLDDMEASDKKPRCFYYDADSNHCNAFKKDLNLCDPLKVENEKLRERGARLFDKTLELGTENAKLRELCADMLRCIHHIDELDLVYYAPSKQGCGMDCVVNGEDCCAKQLHDRARELGIEVSR